MGSQYNQRRWVQETQPYSQIPQVMKSPEIGAPLDLEASVASQEVAINKLPWPSLFRIYQDVPQKYSCWRELETMVENCGIDLKIAVGEVGGSLEMNFCWKRWHRHRENCAVCMSFLARGL
jgi:hypothetical protein